MNTRAHALVSGLFLGALVLLATRPVHACMCAPQTCDQSMRAAVAVFEGLVLEVEAIDADAELGPTQLRVHMRVTESWTRGLAEDLIVRTSASSAACGYPFEVGRSYLVYADVGSAEAPAVTLCSGTKPREQAQHDLGQLGMGVVPVSPSQATVSSSTSVAHAGCAGCSIGSRSTKQTSAMTWMIMTLGLLLLRLRRINS